MQKGILINNFIGGWQNAISQEAMSEYSLFTCTDFFLDIIGILRCRDLHEASSLFSDVTATSPVRNVNFVDVEGTSKFLLAYTIGTGLIIYNSSTGTTHSASTALSTGDHISCVPMKPLLGSSTQLYITDGVTMLSDTGTATTTWGIDAPNSSPRVTVEVGTGNLSAGDYSYVYTFYDDLTGSESTPSPASTTLTTSANDSVVVTHIQISSNDRVTARILYRTLVSGGSRFYVTKISGNVITSYTDVKDDDDLGDEVETDKDIPPLCDIVINYDDRLFLTGNVNYPNRVYYTRASLPDSVPPTFYFDVGSAGTRIMNAVVWGGLLYFIRRNGIARIYGDAADSYKSGELFSHVGTYARWSVAAGPDGVYFLGLDGVYKFDGRTSIRVSTKIDKSFGISPDSWTSVVDRDTAADVARACFVQGVYYLILPMKDHAGVVSNKLFAYDTQKSAGKETWLMFDSALDDVAARKNVGKLYGSIEELSGGGNNTVYDMFSVDTSTEDSPNVYAVTKSYSCVGTDTYKVSKQGSLVGTQSSTVEWLRKFRIDAEGAWTLGFYLDGRLVHTETITATTAADRYKWYNFPTELKGRYVFVTITATGSPRPATCVFRELEIQ